MKRSEMINILADALERYENSFYKYDMALKAIEAAGMFPPKEYGTMGQVISQGWDKEDEVRNERSE